MKNKKIIIVGAGFSGAYVARELAEENYKVLVVEKRNHIGGNMYDYEDKETGCLVQKYGPHIFHTDDEEIWRWLNKFSVWNNFALRTTVEMKQRGNFMNCPFDFSAIDKIFNEEQAKELKEYLTKTYGYENRVTIPTLLNSKNELVQELAQYLWNYDYKLYTSKQWGVPADQVDPSILTRVPYFVGYNAKVHSNVYEALPAQGYTQLFKNILNHKNITIQLNTNALEHITLQNGKVYYENEEVVLVYTGAIDELFDYKFGELEYRSLTFKFTKSPNMKTEYGDACVKVYPSLEYPFTRITHYGKLPIQNHLEYEICGQEYSHKFSRDNLELERYYPIKNTENSQLYLQYAFESEKYKGLCVIGRLGLYKYLDMDKTLSLARYYLNVIKQKINHKTYTITGATGYIGGTLLSQVYNEDDVFNVIVKKGSDTNSFLGYNNIYVYEYDGTETSLIEPIKNSDYLVHLGAYYTANDSPENILELLNSNVVFSSQLFNVANTHNKDISIVTASTFSSFDNDGSLKPLTFYAATKSAVETIAHYYTDLSIKFLTFPDTYGPYDERPKIHNILLKNEKWPFQFRSSSEQKIAMLHVYDIIGHLLEALEITDKGVHFLDIFKTAPVISLLELSKLITDKECLFNENAKLLPLPNKTNRKTTDSKYENKYTDLNKIKEVLQEGVKTDE